MRKHSPLPRRLWAQWRTLKGDPLGDSSAGARQTRRILSAFVRSIVPIIESIGSGEARDKGALTAACRLPNPTLVIVGVTPRPSPTERETLCR
jgi:hypothetical protein